MKTDSSLKMNALSTLDSLECSLPTKKKSLNLKKNDHKSPNNQLFNKNSIKILDDETIDRLKHKNEKLCEELKELNKIISVTNKTSPSSNNLNSNKLSKQNPKLLQINVHQSPTKCIITCSNLSPKNKNKLNIEIDTTRIEKIDHLNNLTLQNNQISENRKIIFNNMANNINTPKELNYKEISMNNYINTVISKI